MKKLIGLILALCMLSTVALAVSPITGDATPDDTAMKILVDYEGLTAGVQATMLAYEVTGVENASASTAYAGEETTPIVGIDQEASDGVFEVQLASTFLDAVEAGSSRSIVVKVGGAGIEEPMSWLVTFTKAAEGGGEGEGGEEGGETSIDVTVSYGDVNGDGAIGAADASLILQKAGTVIKSFTHSANGSTIPDTVGDVNGDGAVGAADASLVLQKAGTLLEGFTDQAGNALTEYTYSYVPVATEE